MTTTPSAAPIATEANPTKSSLVNKDGWQATTSYDLPENHRLKFYTWKHGSTGQLITIASVCRFKKEEGYESEQHIMGLAGNGDYRKTIVTTKPARVTEKVVKGQHELAVYDHFDDVLEKVTDQYGWAMKLPGHHRPIRLIALEIERLWQKPYFGAVPYIRAMRDVVKPGDAHGCEDGRTQVIYFLSNATTWKGDDARRIKAELKTICGIK